MRLYGIFLLESSVYVAIHSPLFRGEGFLPISAVIEYNLDILYNI